MSEQFNPADHFITTSYEARPEDVNRVLLLYSGGLDTSVMLKWIQDHYDAEVEYATRRLTTAMGPILIVAMSVMVGFFALAVYMPMWDLTKMASHAK